MESSPHTSDTTHLLKTEDLIAASALHQGGREKQQDALIMKQHSNHPNLYLFAVSDGLGGHSGGEIASHLTIEAVCKSFDEIKEPNIGSREQLKIFVKRAQHAVVQHQHYNQHTNDMRATLAVLMYDSSTSESYWTHIGDSRVYRCNLDKRATLRSRDHTPVQIAIERESMTEKAARHAEGRSGLLKAIGHKTKEEETLAISEHDLMHVQGNAGISHFLLCSDGMWQFIYDDEIILALLRADAYKNPSSWLRNMEQRRWQKVYNEEKWDNDNYAAIAICLL